MLCEVATFQAAKHGSVSQLVRNAPMPMCVGDTYGHLFPGQEADAVGRMREMLVGPPKAMRATGTDDAVAPSQSKRSTRRSAQDAKRCVLGASGYDERAKPVVQKESPKPLQIADSGDNVRDNASEDESRAGGTRTPNQQIMSLLL